MDNNDFFRIYDKVLPLVKDDLRASDSNIYKYNSCTIGVKKGRELIYKVRLSDNELLDDINDIADEILAAINNYNNNPQIHNYTLMQLKVYLDNIINSDDRQQFGDIIKCYEFGLLRAGYLLGWLLLMESLKGKIFALANKGVKVAIQERDKVLKIEEQRKSTDIAICDAARFCDIITDESRSELDLLWQKRCIMGHPYTPKVKEADFLYLIDKLVGMSLSVPLMWSRTMINDFFDDIKKAPHLIPLSQQDIMEDISNKLNFIPERLYPCFWKTLFFEFSISLDRDDSKLQKYLNLMAMKFLRDKELDINERKFELENMIINYPNVCWRIFYSPKIWDLLNDNYKDQLFRYIEDKKSNNILRRVYKVVKSGKGVTQKHLDNYYNALKRFNIESVYDFYIDKDNLVSCIYDKMIKTGQYTNQGDYVELLKSKQNDIGNFNDSQKEKLGYYLLLCCTNGAWKAQGYAVSRSGKWFQDKAFLYGFAKSGITNDGVIRIDNMALRYSISLLKNLPDDVCQNILDRLSGLPVNEKSGIHFDKRQTEEILEENLSHDSVIYCRLKEIADSYYGTDNEKNDVNFI